MYNVILHKLIVCIVSDFNCCPFITNPFSYGFGLLGSLAYMRMLGNTVDSMADGAKGLVKYVSLGPWI